MSDYIYRTKTNDKADSTFDVQGHLMPARAFFFVTVDELGRDGILVRNTYTDINDPNLLEYRLTPLGNRQQVYPERLGIWPKGTPDSSASIARHILTKDKILTPYVSASGNYPNSAERFDGKSVYIDIAKAKRDGARIVGPSEIERDIDSYLKDNPSKQRREGNYIKEKALGVDKEYLIKPNPMVEADAVFSQKGLAFSLGLSKVARVVHTTGVFFTGYDLAWASQESIEIKSIRPLRKEVLRNIAGWEGSIAGRWAGAVAGARIGAAVGVMCGIEVGPLVAITGAIGGIMGGALGYFGESYLLDKEER